MRIVGMKLTSLLLLLVFPSAVMAGESGAMVFPATGVSVNGSELSRPSAVLSGDKIATAGSAASLTLSGTSVQIAPKSEVVYTNEALTVDNGAANVATSSGESSRVMNLTVRPATNGKARYMLGKRDGKVLVAALEGKIVLNDGSRQMYLEAGKAISMPVAETAPQAGGAGGAGTVPAATTGVTLSNFALIGIVVAAAALGAALAYGITQAVSPGAASPTVP